MLRNWLASLLGRTTRPATTDRRPALEALEDRSVPSATTVLNSLHDSGVRNLAAADYHRDHALTRTDVIGIFREAAHDGKVTTTELSDLKTLAGHGGEMGMTAAVQDLAGKVVGPNAANKHYQGHALVAGGQLKAGQTGGQLTELVDKWFLGDDLPAARDDDGVLYDYQAVSGRLFGAGGPSYTDVGQGHLGDCYFIASLGEVALASPQSIRNMFTANGDGTWTVRFFHQEGTRQVADYVTVNRELPESGGCFIFAGGGSGAFQPISSASNVLWVALAEKAYAQLAEEGWSRPGHSANSYRALIGGTGKAPLQQVLGEATQEVGGGSLTKQNINTLIADVQAGKLITLCTKSGSGEYFSGTNIIKDHTYYLKGYNAKTGLFTLVNPWGYDHWLDGTVQVSAAQLMSHFDSFSVAARHGV